MRTSKSIATTIGGLAALIAILGATPVRAEDEAPTDPTRGQWDSFLDPVRDAEDEYVVGTQKKIEDATKIHVAAGIQKAWTWAFNKPPSGTNLGYDLFDTHNSPSIDIAITAVPYATAGVRWGTLRD